MRVPIPVMWMGTQVCKERFLSFAKSTKGEKIMKKNILKSIFMLFIFLVLCSNNGKLTVQAKNKYDKTIFINVKKSSRIIAPVKKGHVKWSVSRPSVLSVKKIAKYQYRITGKKVGQAIVKIKTSKKTYAYRVKVENPRLSKRTASVTVGSKITLKMMGTEAKITWKTSNKKVASIKKISEEQYQVIGRKIGTAKISAKVNGTIRTCTIKVTAKKTNNIPDTTTPVTSNVEKITLNEYSLTLYAGDSYQLYATISPLSAGNKKVTWSSGDPSLVSVTSDGLVKVSSDFNGESGYDIAIRAQCDGKKAVCWVHLPSRREQSKSILTNWIQRNYTSYSNGSYTYAIGRTSGSLLDIWAVNYDTSTKNISLGFARTQENFLCEIEIELSGLNGIFYYYWGESDYNSPSSKTSLPIASFTGYNLKFGYPLSDSASANSRRNSWFRYGMGGWNDIFNMAGLTYRDLGFTGYTAPVSF